MRAACILAVTTLAAACGQTGALYLPDEGVESPVEIRTPGTSEPKEAEKKNGEPPDS